MKCGDCGNTTAAHDGFPNNVFCKRFCLHMEKTKDANGCRGFWEKPKTNADRIRAMSDEELAKYLSAIFAPYFSRGREYWIDWLKQEVTVNDS